MADKVTLMRKWFDDIVDDPNIDTTEQELAYMIYAAYMYGTTGEKVNIGEVFGKEFKLLNMMMPNIYGQIDNIMHYDPSNGKNVKYDAEAIKECRLRGLSAKEICVELGYPEARSRSITSNKGWIEAGKILKGMEEGVQKLSESVQNDFKNSSEKYRNVQKNTEMDRSVLDTENNVSVQKSVNGFDF